ncbi:MAG: hemolysin family protein [Bacteroidales bacterium]|jgi:CBS domain containing-hemolysin-like protein|nr:hemolysin family protein [Bacteroidales bacterium]
MSPSLWVVVSLIFAAFFSGLEVAFISSNKLRVELDRKQGKFSSGIISIFMNNPGQYLSTMLVGYCVALVVYGIFMTAALWNILVAYIPTLVLPVLVLIVVAALLFFIVVELVSRVLFQINPNVSLNIFAIPLLVFYILLYPIPKIIIGIANIFLRIFTKFDPQKSDKENVFRKVDLNNFTSEVQPVAKSEQDAEHEIKIFQNAIDFSSVKIRDCMIPRTDIVAVDENTSILDLKQKFIDTGVSKIIVYTEDIDNIIGYVHSKELFKNPESIQSMTNPITFVPETMSANKLMQLFMCEHKSIAIVVDEYGGTSGLLTLEDLIEEIFGDIEDEHDKDNLVERKVNDHEYLLSGRLEIEYINETFHLDIPEKDDYDTLAGFILYHHLNFPLAGEVIEIEPYTFIIRKISNTRIDLVQMIINKK